MWTLGWIIWLAAFFVWETLSLLDNRNQELTEHLRPVFLSQPITWFLALGLWLWIGYHFLLEAGTPFIREVIEDVTRS